jgi:hypothetical protein
MTIKCNNCGADNADDAERCSACDEALGQGDVPDGVEIEVYDIGQPAERKPTYFEETLAATRESARGKEAPAGRTAGSPGLEEELRPGYEIRQRRVSHRLRRPRNVILITVAAVALAVAVIYGVRWGVGRLPKYEYAEPAHVASTNVALELAGELESAKVDNLVARGEPYAALTVRGDGGRVFVDGNYVADVPASNVPVPTGRHHVVVKRGHEIALDETLDFRARERYALEPTGAAALAGPR